MARSIPFRPIGAVGVSLAAVVMMLVVGCGEDQQAQRHQIPVFADGEVLEPIKTDRDYEVEVESVVVRVHSLEFTVGGEAHDEGEFSLLDDLSQLVVADAYAHPNHASGGEVGGIVEGPVTIVWRPGEDSQIAEGEFLEGEYAGYNVDFAAGGADGEADGEGLREGMVARIEGVVTDPQGETMTFGVDVEYAGGASVVGGALSAVIPDDEMKGISVQLKAYDQWSERSLFDGVRFSNHVDDQQHAEIDPGSTDAARVHHGLTAHEFYDGRVIR